VFSNDEVPEHVVEALEDAGYECGGGSGPKTTLSLGADEPRAVAESYFGAEVVVDTEDLKEIAASRER
jgi:hypothetical protein